MCVYLTYNGHYTHLLHPVAELPVPRIPFPSFLLSSPLPFPIHNVFISLNISEPGG